MVAAIQRSNDLSKFLIAQLFIPVSIELLQYGLGIGKDFQFSDALGEISLRNVTLAFFVEQFECISNAK